MYKFAQKRGFQRKTLYCAKISLFYKFYKFKAKKIEFLRILKGDLPFIRRGTVYNEAMQLAEIYVYLCFFLSPSLSPSLSFHPLNGLEMNMLYVLQRQLLHTFLRSRGGNRSLFDIQSHSQWRAENEKNNSITKAKEGQNKTKTQTKRKHNAERIKSLVCFAQHFSYFFQLISRLVFSLSLSRFISSAL